MECSLASPCPTAIVLEPRLALCVASHLTMWAWVARILYFVINIPAI